MKTIDKVLFFTLAVSLVGVMFGMVSPFYNPVALAAEESEQVHMKINGMTCGGCASAIKSSLAKLPEVKGSDVNFKKGTADVKVAKGSDHVHLVNAVKEAGFTVSSLECECKGAK